MKSTQFRTAHRSSVIRDLQSRDHVNEGLLDTLREYDRSSPWINIGATGAPAFQNSWTNLGGGWSVARFMRDAAGIVIIQGLVANLNTATTTTLFVLPDGFRIGDDNIFNLISFNGTIHRHVECQVRPNGEIAAYWFGGDSMPWLSLAGISYPAES
jgi:hypothetical protein